MALGSIGEDDERMRKNEKLRELESERKKKEMVVFVERKKESYREYEEVREMKRMRKKKRLVTVEKNEKARTHLMAKLRVV